MASRHVKQSGMCNLFKGYDTYSDYIISAQNQGEESFNQLTPTEKKVVKKFSYGNCMYRDGRYSYEEFLSYVRSSFEELVTPDQDLKYLISLTTKPEIIKAGGWFLDNKMDAKTCRNKGIEINTKDAETYYKRGLAKKNSADYQGAIADYSKALELNPKYAKAYFSRGIAQIQLNDYSRSIADLNKAIELNPSEAKMYFSRGLVKELQGEQNKRDACVDLRKASSLGDKDAAKWVSQKCTNY